MDILSNIKFFLGLLLIAYCPLSYAEADISLRLGKFIAKTDVVASSDTTTRTKSNEIMEEYFANFSTDAAAIPKDELDEFFEATQYMMFYTMDKAKLPRFEKIFMRLIDAQEATPKHYRDVLQAYFALREFKKANKLMERHGAILLPNRPLVVEDLSSLQARRTAWFFQGHRQLTRLDVDLNKGVHLMIIGSPYCHFASTALAEMESDPALRPLLASRVKVIAMNDFSFNYDVYTAWNMAHPSLPFGLAHNRDEWPEVTRWVSPVFLFFRNGELKSQFSGWPEEGHMDKIYTGFGLTVATDWPASPR
jgi:hypothetical protein